MRSNLLALLIGVNLLVTIALAVAYLRDDASARLDRVERNTDALFDEDQRLGNAVGTRIRANLQRQRRYNRTVALLCSELRKGVPTKPPTLRLPPIPPSGRLPKRPPLSADQLRLRLFLACADGGLGGR
jgi:hypothetical protein